MRVCMLPCTHASTRPRARPCRPAGFRMHPMRAVPAACPTLGDHAGQLLRRVGQRHGDLPVQWSEGSALSARGRMHGVLCSSWRVAAPAAAGARAPAAGQPELPPHLGVGHHEARRSGGGAAAAAAGAVAAAARAGAVAAPAAQACACGEAASATAPRRQARGAAGAGTLEQPTVGPVLHVDAAERLKRQGEVVINPLAPRALRAGSPGQRPLHLVAYCALRALFTHG